MKCEGSERIIVRKGEEERYFRIQVSGRNSFGSYAYARNLCTHVDSDKAIECFLNVEPEPDPKSTGRQVTLNRIVRDGTTFKSKFETLAIRRTK